MPTTEQEVMCPKCGGRTWDNRLSKKNPKAPDYKCRNRACDGVVWPPKEGAARTTKQPISAGPLVPGLDDQEEDERRFVERVNGTEESALWKDVRARYIETFQWVLKHVEPALANYKEPTLAELLSVTATLYIERNNRNC